MKKNTGRRAMSISTIGYMLLALFLMLILTFIYFGHTGFFQKIYKLTDKLGLTKFAKSVQDVEQNITEARKKLSPEQEGEEEQIRSVMNSFIPSLQSCVSGSSCTCPISLQPIPEGYAIRFVNMPNNYVQISVFRFKARNWRSDYDENHIGMTGVDFVYGTNYKIENTQMCLVMDLEESWDWDNDVDDIQVRQPVANLLQLYWGKDTWGKYLYKITESKDQTPGVVYNSERDYEIYGKGAYMPNTMYKTLSVKPGRLCFFAERYVDEDTDLVDNIVCGKSKEEEDN